MVYQLTTIFPFDTNLFLRSDWYDRYDVCEVYPLRESHFRIIASARIKKSPTRDASLEFCTQNEIIILTGAIFVIWNYISDTWIKWESDLHTVHLQASTKSPHVLNQAELLLPDLHL